MRILFAIIALGTLSGCESLGEVIREKKYTVNFHETANAKHKLGYNDDFHYVGYIIVGKFGATIHKHEHYANCPHEIATAAAAGN